MLKEKVRTVRVADIVAKPHLVGALYKLAEGTHPTSCPEYGKLMLPPEDGFILRDTRDPGARYQMISVTGTDINGDQFTRWLHDDVRLVRVPKASAQGKTILGSAGTLGYDKVLALEIQQRRPFDKVGADPEVFVVDAQGEMIPSFEFLPDKKSGQPVYWDGYQGEFITRAETCMAWTMDSIQYALIQMHKKANAYKKGARVTLKNTFNIPQERLATDDPKFVQFGCTPSLNVYSDEKPIQVDGAMVPFRSAGGHLHFTVSNKALIPQYVKRLDSILGVLTVSLFQYYDDSRRRSLYGRAGEYRTPTYGFEYRVLSNAWLAHPVLGNLMYEIARFCIGSVSYRDGLNKWQASEEEVRTCINECDVKLAQKIIERNKVVVKSMLAALPGVRDSDIPRGTAVGKWYEVFINGVHKYLKTPDYLSDRWGLDGRHFYHCDAPEANVKTATRYLIKNNKLD